MRICRVATKKNKRRRVWDGAKKRVEGTVFAEFQYNRSKTPPIIKEWKQHGRRWKNESNQLREIAAINADINEMRNNVDNKEEENDIMIAVPENKPSFRKTESMPTISGISRTSRTGKSGNKRPMKGSMYNRRSRPQSNTSMNSSDLSLQGTARNNNNPRVTKKNGMKNKNKATMKDVNKDTNTKSTRSSRRNSMTKKPGIPKFEPRKATMNNRRQSISKRNNTKTIEPTKSVPNMARKSRPERNANVNNTNKPMTRKTVKPSPIQKEHTIKAQQPRLRKNKSEASSLSRGLELGMNVNKIFDDTPKTMNDYVERERLRRQKRGTGKGTSSSTGLGRNRGNGNMNANMNKSKPKPSLRSRPDTKASVPTITKKMNRLQIKKEIKIDNQQIGGKRMSKPSNSKDLASKRAAYFERLLENPEQ
eukprot:CAMPEP_0201596968 /NCGR_PEP_ID=MMETSP0190_2-20130828/193557_1 /ASSEMBLY_ACC=CAM_ASM_000263 /TAXON_ID=37353 /ORGANISM="Rosalina sp." /LENGTH=420 /DNA_ID=CAMNT_0048057657 /DNA_START=710 /DNA_END=1972 /DNA_ORIENTATION=+